METYQQKRVAIIIFVVVIVILILFLIFGWCWWNTCNNTKPVHQAQLIPVQITSLPISITDNRDYFIDTNLSYGGNGPAITITGVPTIQFVGSGKITITSIGSFVDINKTSSGYGSFLSGIYVSGSQRTKIINPQIVSTTIAPNYTFGIIFENCTNVDVEGGTFNGLYVGIHSVNSTAVKTIRCSFVDMYDQVDVNDIAATKMGVGVGAANSTGLDVIWCSFTTTKDRNSDNLATGAVFLTFFDNTNISISSCNGKGLNQGIRALSGAGLIISSCEMNIFTPPTLPFRGGSTTCVEIGQTSGAGDSIQSKFNDVVLNGSTFTSNGGPSVHTRAVSGFVMNRCVCHTLNTDFNIIQITGTAANTNNSAVIENCSFRATNMFDGGDGVALGSTRSFNNASYSFKNNTIAVDLKSIPDVYTPGALHILGPCSGVVLEGNVVSSPSGNSTGPGILIEGVIAPTVNNNTITGFSQQISFSGVTAGVIKQNTINGEGIFFSNTDCSVINDNDILNGCVSVNIDNTSDGNIVSNNRLTCIHNIQDFGTNTRIVDNIVGETCGICDNITKGIKKISKRITNNKKESDFQSKANNIIRTIANNMKI